MSEQIPEPGRERDALVAERVMGWRRWQPVNQPPDNRFNLWVYDNGQLTGNLPAWSTDDAAALDVLKAMEARGWGWEINGSPVAKAYAAFWLIEEPAISAGEFGESIADAITAAALSAVATEEGTR